MDAKDFERFERGIQVNAQTGCHEWRLYKDKDGYGRFIVRRPRIVTRLAHRVAYEHHVGPLAGKLCVLHRCDNPSCVNPDHLFLGTHQGNMDDKKAKGRVFKPLGELNGRSRITEEDARAIRERHAAGIGQKELALEHGVHPNHISDIVNRKRWAHI